MDNQLSHEDVEGVVRNGAREGELKVRIESVRDTSANASAQSDEEASRELNQRIQRAKEEVRRQMRERRAGRPKATDQKERAERA